MSEHRHAPESFAAFKQAAKDLAFAYNLKLSVAQETLARIFGYADLHEISRVDLPAEHRAMIKRIEREEADCKSHPMGQRMASRFAERQRTQKALDALLTDDPSSDRKFAHPIFGDLDDLMLFSHSSWRQPAMWVYRRAVMEIQAAQNGPRRKVDQPGHHVSDYLHFELIRPQDDDLEEACFYRTMLGEAVHQALLHLLDHDDAASIVDLRERHPSCPEAFMSTYHLFDYDDIDDWINEEGGAAAFHGKAELLIAQMRSLLPNGYMGLLDPKLLSLSRQNGQGGNGNGSYVDLLGFAAASAATLGNTRASKNLSLEQCIRAPSDGWGARFQCLTKRELTAVENSANRCDDNPYIIRNYALKRFDTSVLYRPVAEVAPDDETAGDRASM